MELLMISHLLGDFYFQTDNLARQKKASIVYTVNHCLIYCVVMYVVLGITTGKWIEYIACSLLAGVLHLVVDIIKCIIYKNGNFKKRDLMVFIMDQLAHIVILLVISRLYAIKFNICWIPGIIENHFESVNKLPVIIFAILLCGKPASVIVSLVFSLIPQTIEDADSKDGENVYRDVKEKDNNEKESDKLELKEEIKIGAWIGILEREIILILGLIGEYGAIGFVVAAKSLVRHSKFDKNPAFAEKYLVGTLLSSLIALLSIIMCLR